MKKRNLLLLAAITFGMGNLWALDQVDGVYQIANGDDLVEFAGIVNGGENGANAVLTADIDMTGKTWTPIGDNDHRYIGTFDGQFHVIDNLKYEGGEKIGIFGVVNGGCVIKNLIAGPNNEIKGTSKVGGIVGCEDGAGWVTFENVGHEGYVYGTGANCCAIIGVVMNGGPATRMTNCYNTGNIRGGNESAIITGWFGGHGSVEVKGFWNTGSIEWGQDGDNFLWRNNQGITTENIFNINTNQGATLIEDGSVASGKLAYTMNGSTDAGFWRQNLEGDNKDAHPTFDTSHALVYANGEQNCDGSAKEGAALTYSNTEGAVRDAHDFVHGYCSNCNTMQENYLTEEDGFYLIGDGYQLVYFSDFANNHANNANAKLTADIDMKDLAWTPIGQDGKDYKGNFNGQGHRILNLTTSSDKNDQALFGQAVGGAVIENIIIDASCTIQGNQWVAGILGHVWGDGVIVRNCGNEANVNGNKNAAGIIGCSQKIVTIENCYNLGNITGPLENAGICAWMGSNSSIIRNCYSTGTVENGNGMWRKDEVSGENLYQINGNQGTAFTAEQLSSGELAYIMNGLQSDDVVWYQVIGTDNHPVPVFIEGGVVYANGSLYCDGIAKPDVVYENEKKTSVRDDHHFNDWGFCDNEHDGTKCDEPQPNYMTAVGGYYEIETAKQLNWFAVYADRVDPTVNGKLMNDLDVTVEVANFPGIASAANPYSGTFDGQFNTLKINMNYDHQSVGFINAAKEGTVVKNLTITGSVKGASFTGAFIGRLNGNGTALFENCGNEATVTTTNQNAGGLLGCNTSGELKVTVKDSYNAGEITSGNEAGGLAGWFGNDAQMYNVYNIGTVNNGESFGRGNNIQLNASSYDVKTNWPGMNIITAEEAADGTLLAALAGNVWHQKKDAHPVLNKEYDLDENFADQKFYAHENANVTFYRTTVADTWNTFAAPVALTAGQVAEVFGEGAKVAEFKGIDGEWASFKTVAATEAGKAYLVLPTEAKTTFNVTADLSDAAPAAAGFQGVYTPTALTSDDLFVAAGNTLQVAKSGSLKAYRAYFKGAAASGAKFFTVDGETNGIIGIDGNVVTAKEVYNLNGQRVNAAQKGVYIVNGKKVVM